MIVTPKIIICKTNQYYIMITPLPGVIEMLIKEIKIELTAVKHIIGQLHHQIIQTAH